MSADKIEQTRVIEQTRLQVEATRLREEPVEATRVLNAGNVELTLLRTLNGPAGEKLTELPPLPNPRYELLGPVGQGGMASVEAARDAALRRTVAFKRLHEGVQALPGLAQRFLTEAQLTAQLDHPNVVPVYALERDAHGRIAYAMKLVRGRTLAELLDEPLPATRTARREARAALIEHFLKVCDALTYAHARGVIHRDLKPANIMVGAFNEVYVMDWGIARIIGAPDLCAADLPVTDAGLGPDPASERTRAGDRLGTPAWMAPEQARGETVDAKSDQYALGLILQQMLSRQRAIPGHDLDSVLAAAARGERRALAGEPAALVAILNRACALQPARRYVDVAAFAADLRAWRADEAVSALPDTGRRRLLRWIGRHRAATAITLLASLALGAGFGAWMLYRHAEALEAAGERERLVSDRLDATALQAARIESQFLQYRGLLTGIANAALLAFDLPDAGAQAEPGLDVPAPAVLPASQYHGLAIDAWHPAWRPAPGAAGADAGPGGLARLAPLLRHAYALADDPARPWRDPAAQRLLVADDDTVLIWVLVARADGAELRYPGLPQSGWPAGYDPRREAWYQDRLPADAPETDCDEPYLSPLVGEWLLPCAQRISALDGRVRGVAMLAFSLDELARRSLLPEVAQAQAAWLVADDGHVLASAGVSAAGPGSDFAGAAGAPAIDAGHGVRDRPQGGLRIWTRIESLGWRYVVDYTR
ncbi:MAG TPA: serine/threonine protein kinase [Plasticicumulans sp.]|nr:serine/threonine protein kinase [Plasticicumulans sp.]